MEVCLSKFLDVGEKQTCVWCTCVSEYGSAQTIVTC